MKKNQTILLLVFITIPSILFSQITITQSDFTSLYTIGNTYVGFTDTLGSVDIGQLGGGNNWNFTNVNSHFSREGVFIAPTETPYADSFANANLCNYIELMLDLGEGSSGISEIWAYFNSADGKTYGSFSNLVDESGTKIYETVTYNYPPFVEYEFPLTANKMWSVKDSSETKTTYEGNSSFGSVSSSIHNGHIDAWGTMTMPSGKVVEALRSREQQIFTSYFFGIPIGTFISVSYTFMAKTGEMLSIEADEENPATSGVITGDVNWINDGVTSAERLETLPESFSLSQNYPNPFNPTTKIEYSITESSLVKLKVYDILGNEVAELVNETQTSGIYRYEFNGSNLSSGTYIVQLYAGDLMEIRKMILLK